MERSSPRMAAGRFSRHVGAVGVVRPRSSPHPVSCAACPQFVVFAPIGDPGMAHGEFMGIRYFAYPVSPRQIAQSRECPRGCFDGDDAWHWEPGAEPTLDLDKCYPELQRALGGDQPRASYALVEGAVTHTG